MYDYISNNKKMIIVSRRTEFYHATKIIDVIKAPSLLEHKTIREYFADRKYLAGSIENMNTILAAICLESNILCYHFYNFQCTEEGQKCEVFDRDGRLLYLDANAHFTHAGAKYFGKRMHNSIIPFLDNINK